MKNTHYIHELIKPYLLPLFIGATVAFTGISGVNAGEIFNTDFSKGAFADLGWLEKGGWKIADMAAKKADVQNNPGPVATFPAGGSATGTLIKKFDPITNPILTLTFGGGYGWGGKDQSQPLQVMIVDAEGNGYGFDCHRASATWGVQWAKVVSYAFPPQLSWAADVVDTTQTAVIDGGGLRTFTITRDASGNWKFSGEGWKGGPLAFTDTTTTTFSQVVLFGSPNTVDQVFNKIKLDAEASK